jgi:branched-chain amino acid transport system substrate-binding protein
MSKVVWAGALAVALLALGCDDENNTPEDILIGTITSTSGSLADYGEGWANAVRLAVQQANAAGGLLDGRDVVLRVEDDRTDAVGGGEAAQALVDAGVVGVIGAPASGSSLQAAAIFGPATIPQISGASTSPDLNAVDGEGGDAHPFFFRTVPADQLQGTVLAGLARGEYDNENITFACASLAIVYIDNPYGTPFANAIRTAFTTLGGTIAVEVPYEDGLTDADGEAQELIDAAPDCVAMVAYPTEGGLIVRAFDSLGGGDIPWFGTEGVKGSDFITEIGDYAANFVGTAPSNDPTSPEFTAFSQNYLSAFGGREPTIFAHNMYDAAALLILAIAAADSTDGTAIRDALFDVSMSGTRVTPGTLVSGIGSAGAGTDINYDGAGGSVDFLDMGDVLSDYEIWRWNDTDGLFDTVASVRAEDIPAN